MNFIIKKLFSGKLFINNAEEGDYTPFNWFFIDKMENIFNFFEETRNIYLPKFIENFINNKLPNDYNYEFFEENKEEIYANISICFSIDTLFYLIKSLEKNEILLINNPKNNRLKIIISQLKNDSSFKDIKVIDEKNKIIQIENLKKIEKNKIIEIKNYYLFNDKEIENKYSYLFSINNNFSNFYIDIKKEEKNRILDDKEKDIIKIKNYLSSSLGNYRLLNKADFNTGEFSNTIKILNKIKLYMSLPNFIVNNNTIPSVWYINSILDLLKNIPEDYKENDYKKLFDELTQNLNDSIHSLDFEKLIIFKNKLKFMDKMESYYEKAKELINNIIINKKLSELVEKLYIPINIKFNYSENEKIFEIIKIDSKKKNCKCDSIEAFTRYFPNLSKYQLIQGINPLDIIEELSISKKINNYLQIIKDKIIKNKIIELKQYENSYSQKMKDYIMNKIYEKIYPPEPSDLDNEIFQKAINLSWVEPNIIIEKDYIFDNMLPDILNEFNQINILKSPYRKFNCLENIFSHIINLIKFNEGIDKEIGAEEITPVLNYAFIKSHPYKIHTDIEFIKKFPEKIIKESNILTNFESMYKLILRYTAESFNLSKEYYRQSCINAIKNNNN